MMSFVREMERARHVVRNQGWTGKRRMREREREEEEGDGMMMTGRDGERKKRVVEEE